MPYVAQKYSREIETETVQWVECETEMTFGGYFMHFAQVKRGWLTKWVVHAQYLRKVHPHTFYREIRVAQIIPANY